MASTLLLFNAGATLALFGLIWTVQLVHYPMFAGMDPKQFPRWHEIHASRISLIVGPLMGLEAVTAVLLFLAPPAGIPPALLGAGLGLVVAHLASTAFLQVPLHRRLTNGFDPGVVRRLVRTNWLRTWIWTARTALVIFLIERTVR